LLSSVHTLFGTTVGDLAERVYTHLPNRLTRDN